MNEAEIKQAAEEYVDYGLPYERQMDQRQGFIAGAEANAPKWTLCTDALPDPESRVFVLANKGKTEYGNCFIMYYGLVEDDKMEWIFDGDIVKPYMTPTHWMPLPSPPNTQP